MVKQLQSKIRYGLGVARSEVASRLSSKHRALKVGTIYSECDRARLLGLQELAEEVKSRRLTGDVVECGVYRGGSAVVIAERLLRASRARRMWLFDVFSGMPCPGTEDPPEAWEHVDKYVSSEAVVRETFNAAGLTLDQVRIVRGRYEETLVNFRPQPTAFLHVDCDWYESVKLCLKTFYDSVVPGGAIIFDDYGFWSGCRKAVDEFLSERSSQVRLKAIDSTSHYFFKE